jgi:hypothetical protein
MVHGSKLILQEEQPESWAHIEDPVERRKIQNRISQRNYRKADIYLSKVYTE